MKKTNIPFSLVLLTLLLFSCGKDEVPDYSELLLGTWVNTIANEQTVLTDSTFTMEFKSNNTELYAIGFKEDENNKSWHENSSYTYSISGNLISIDGIDVQENSYHMVFDILSIDDKTLTFLVPTFIVNGEVIANPNTFTCEKVTDDLSAEFTGTWHGRCTTEGHADSLFHYWEYFDDGTYNYYYQIANSTWIKKSDNEGRYFLYGQFLASNYSHDLLSGGTGLAFECWNFTLDGNNMVWTGLRENNVTITYEMEKVPSPPETGQ